MTRAEFTESTVWAATEGASGFEIAGTSGGGGGGGRGAGAHGEPGRPGASAPWHSQQAPLVPGRQYVFVIGAGGLGGWEALPGEERGEAGHAGGITYVSDGDDYLQVIGGTGASTDLPNELMPPAAIGPPPAATSPRFAIVDPATRRVDNVIIGRQSFFEHSLARRVVLDMRLVERDGHFALEPRRGSAIPVPLSPDERVAPGWFFLEAVSPDQPRFILPAWPRQPRGRFGAVGGTGGASRPDPDLSGTLQILCVGTEWSSSKGGISTLNRDLCIAMAALDHQVDCLVPPGTVDADAHADATSARVRLIEAPVTTGKEVGLYGCLRRRPSMPADYYPHVVIGHGWVTGSAAQTLVQDHFQSAVCVHVIHTQPDEIEPYKDRNSDASMRTEISQKQESVLARSALLS